MKWLIFVLVATVLTLAVSASAQPVVKPAPPKSSSTDLLSKSPSVPQAIPPAAAGMSASGSATQGVDISGPDALDKAQAASVGSKARPEQTIPAAARTLDWALISIATVSILLSLGTFGYTLKSMRAQTLQEKPAYDAQKLQEKYVRDIQKLHEKYARDVHALQSRLDDLTDTALPKLYEGLKKADKNVNDLRAAFAQMGIASGNPAAAAHNRSAPTTRLQATAASPAEVHALWQTAAVAPVAPVAPATINMDPNEVVLRGIELLGRSDGEITEANIAAKLMGTIKDTELRAQLMRREFKVSFFTANGDASSINAELLAWQLDGHELAYVVPYPKIGRVSQFNRWFDVRSADYTTNPVLADEPGRARIEHGKLVPTQLGRLRS